MGIYDYRYLSMTERASLLWEDGNFIGNYHGANTSYNLYKLSGFYVEVVIDNSRNKIEEITPFLRGYRLNKYLDKIDLSNLL